MGTSPLAGARAKRIARIANAEIHADAVNPVDDSWIDEQLAAIGVSRDEYAEVFDALTSGEHAQDDALATADLEDEVLAAYARERKVIQRTNELLTELAGRQDADWDSIAALLDVSVDSLRVRTGRRPSSALNVADALTITAAARVLGVARSTVYEWLESGRLREVSVRGRRMVAADTLGRPLES